MWAVGDRSLRAAGHQPDSIPLQGDRRWGLSLVFRIDGALRDVLSAELDALASRCRAPHLVYAPRHLHSTVRSLEGFQDEVPGSQVRHYADQLLRMSADLAVPQIEYAGLSGTAGGIFVCGYPSDSLAVLRRRLYEDQLPLGALGVPGADADFIRDTAHASLVVYRAPVCEEGALADYVSSRTDDFFGRVSVTALSIVRYRPTARSVHLEELARIPL
jgi:hypothetical protein